VTTSADIVSLSIGQCLNEYLYTTFVSFLAKGSMLGSVILTCSMNRAMFVAFCSLYVSSTQCSIISRPAVTPDELQMGGELE
jgi:hypothetical protein